MRNVAAILLPVLLIISCSSKQQTPNNNANALSHDSKLEVTPAQVLLIDLIKPEFRPPTPSVAIEWKSETIDIGEGTCVLRRNQPYFPDYKQPNAWLKKTFAERMSIFIESCEHPEEGFAGGEFQGFFQVEAGRTDQALLSMSVECTAQFPGGNTSHTGVYSYCFNPKDGSELALHDLFLIEKDSVYRMLKRMVIPRIEDHNVRKNASEIVFDARIDYPGKWLWVRL